MDKKQAIEEFKIRFNKKFKNRKRKPKNGFKPPPYDDIYFEGLKALNSLSGEEIKPLRVGLDISPADWYLFIFFTKRYHRPISLGSKSLRMDKNGPKSPPASTKKPYWLLANQYGFFCNLKQDQQPFPVL